MNETTMRATPGPPRALTGRLLGPEKLRVKSLTLGGICRSALSQGIPARVEQRSTLAGMALDPGSNSLDLAAMP